MPCRWLDCVMEFGFRWSHLRVGQECWHGSAKCWLCVCRRSLAPVNCLHFPPCTIVVLAQANLWVDKLVQTGFSTTMQSQGNVQGELILIGLSRVKGCVQCSWWWCTKQNQTVQLPEFTCYCAFYRHVKHSVFGLPVGALYCPEEIVLKCTQESKTMFRCGKLSSSCLFRDYDQATSWQFWAQSMDETRHVLAWVADLSLWQACAIYSWNFC